MPGQRSCEIKTQKAIHDTHVLIHLFILSIFVRRKKARGFPEAGTVSGENNQQRTCTAWMSGGRAHQAMVTAGRVSHRRKRGVWPEFLCPGSGKGASPTDHRLRGTQGSTWHWQRGKSTRYDGRSGSDCQRGSKHRSHCAPGEHWRALSAEMGRASEMKHTASTHQSQALPSWSPPDASSAGDLARTLYSGVTFAGEARPRPRATRSPRSQSTCCQSVSARSCTWRSTSWLIWSTIVLTRRSRSIGESTLR